MVILSLILISWAHAQPADSPAKTAFSIGVKAFQAGDLPTAAKNFDEAIKLKTQLLDYALYFRGLIEKQFNNLKEAQKFFEKVRWYRPASTQEVNAEIELAHIAKQQEHWGVAYNLLIHLEHAHRYERQYPDILYELFELSLSRGNMGLACNSALKLYTRFPAITLQKGWGFNLSDVRVGNRVLRCYISLRERERHYQQLLLAGEFDQIRNELRDWVTALRKDSNPHPNEVAHLEMQQGILALAEGRTKDAVGHFLTAQDITGRNFTTQMLLAKGYSKTDDYSAAVMGYLRAYNLSPYSRLGKQALFQAAFMSYQYRDYDGASRHFEKVVRMDRGKLAWDARWHLAWIRYLKADYEGAVREFASLSKNRRFADPVDLEKMRYWKAMAQLRQGSLEEAKEGFSQIAGNKRMGYYTGAALARLGDFSGKINVDLSQPYEEPTRGTASIDNSLGGKDHNSEKLQESGIIDLEQPEYENELKEPIQVFTNLKEPALIARLDRARALIDLGYGNWGQLELREIERHTRKLSYLQSLMKEYMRAGDFFRSAYLADDVFGQQREKEGIDGAKLLWTYAFPQAYSEVVSSSSKRFDVNESLIWSIMRAESGFRVDIHSSAGAMGLMQLIPATAKRVAKDIGFFDYKNSTLLTPENNIIFGTRYLKRLNKTMSNNTPLTVAAYNAGPHRVLGWMKDFGDLDMDEFVEHIPYLETRNYVKKVLRNYFIYQSLYSKKSNPLAWLARKPTMRFDGPKPTSESWDD